MSNLFKQTVYRQYRIFVDNEDSQHAESDRLTIQTVQKYIRLHINLSRRKRLRNYANRLQH